MPETALSSTREALRSTTAEGSASGAGRESSNVNYAPRSRASRAESLAGARLLHMKTKATSAKEAALKLVSQLPESCTLEEIQYHLYVRQKIERGLQDVKAGRVLNHAEVERRVAKWRAK